MQRRDLLRVVAGATALQFIPGRVEGLATIGSQLHRSLDDASREARTLSASQLALVTLLCDRILPATDTPGALDVRVPEFIDLVLTEWANDSDRDAFLAGLTQIDERAQAAGGAIFVQLPEEAQLALMRTLDGDRRAKEGAGMSFGQVKDLTVFAYFTSERVTKEVLKTRMSFSTYNGAAEVPA
jgi:gluconate 2-dehydrogenase gamma chain